MPPLNVKEMYTQLYRNMFQFNPEIYGNATYMYIDTEVPLNRRISYKVVASYETGPYSNYSETKTVNVYKY